MTKENLETTLFGAVLFFGLPFAIIMGLILAA